MKLNSSLFIGLWLSVFAHLAAMNQEELFLQGNKLFQQSEIKKALESYNAITKKGPVTWYNRGVCLYLLADYEAAIISWHHAEKQAPWHLYALIDHNIDLAFQQLNKTVPLSVWGLVKQWIVRLIKMLSLGWWQLLLLLCWLMVIMALYKSFYGHGMWRIIIQLILLLVVGTGFMIRYSNATERYALVVGKATVQAGPGADYAEVAFLESLTKVGVDEIADEWVKVHNKQVNGWVSQKELAIIEP